MIETIISSYKLASLTTNNPFESFTEDQQNNPFDAFINNNKHINGENASQSLGQELEKLESNVYQLVDNDNNSSLVDELIEQNSNLKSKIGIVQGKNFYLMDADRKNRKMIKKINDLF